MFCSFFWSLDDVEVFALKSIRCSFSFFNDFVVVEGGFRYMKKVEIREKEGKGLEDYSLEFLYFTFFFFLISKKLC